MSGRIGIKALKPWQLYFKGELTEEELLKADKITWMQWAVTNNMHIII